MMAERLFDRIFTNLAFRKAYHFLGGVALFLMVYHLSDTGFYIACVVYLLAFLAFGKRISFAAAGALLLFAITRSRFATLGAIIIFTLGDGLAALIGSRYGKRHLPWNGRKTMVGSAAFLTGSVVGMFLYISSVSWVPGWEKSLLVFVPSIAACIVESLPITVIRDRKPDDNLIIILVAGVILFLLELLLAIPVDLYGYLTQ